MQVVLRRRGPAVASASSPSSRKVHIVIDRSATLGGEDDAHHPQPEGDEDKADHDKQAP